MTIEIEEAQIYKSCRRILRDIDHLGDLIPALNLYRDRNYVTLWPPQVGEELTDAELKDPRKLMVDVLQQVEKIRGVLLGGLPTT